MYEIASAEEQIALFKLVTDKVWQSLADQKRQEAEQRALAQRSAAASGGVRAKRGAASPKPIKPIEPPKPIKPVPQAPAPVSVASQPLQPTPQQTAQPATPVPLPNRKVIKPMAAQSGGVATQRVAAYPQQRQQSAILPKPPR
jgi:hypothetical protein